MTIRLIQLQNGPQWRVAHVEENELRLTETLHTVYDLAHAAISHGTSLPDILEDDLGDVRIAYDDIHAGQSEWKILPPLYHPAEPARTLVSGTGLTHLGSAQSRNTMHERIGGVEEMLTDSMKMFRWGVESGKPAQGNIGIAPEWFFKGTGTILRGHNQPIESPAHALDAGEEAEIAGLYLIAPDGTPLRIGMAQGNEFSDHVFERKNYLNLAGSKLRHCSIGPEIVINPDFTSIPGVARILRNHQTLWQKPIITGEAEMCHSLANIEHHHFKFAPHRRPGDVHVHFYGACALSFADNITLQNHDIMEVHFENFGRPLRNPLRIIEQPDTLIPVKSLN